MIKWIQKFYFKKFINNKIPEPYSSIILLTEFSLKVSYKQIQLNKNFEASPSKILIFINCLDRRLKNEPI